MGLAQTGHFHWSSLLVRCIESAFSMWVQYSLLP